MCTSRLLRFVTPLLVSALGAAEEASCVDGTCRAAALLQTGSRTKLGDLAGAATATGQCQSWCASKVSTGARTWDTLCGWASCSSCSDCGTTTTQTTTSWQSPYFMVRCSGTQALTTESMTEEDYDDVVASVQELYNSLDPMCNATYCPQADWAGCVLRVAGHDFMDYKDGEGGSDGCLDMHDGDNAGLAECISEGEFGISIADAYADFCTTISLADFFVIAAEAVMASSRQHVLDDDSSRSYIDFKSNFKWGRTTALSCGWAEGRLPNPEDSCSAVETVFVNNMGLSWRQSAALMAVHTLGRADISNSGYNGWWSDAENSRRFNNDYFISILAKGWAPEVAVNGNSAKNQWKRVDVGANEATLGKEMMLNTDMCLAYTMDDDGEVELDAATAVANDCNCTWIAPVFVAAGTSTYNGGEFCGTTDIPGQSDFPAQRAYCCGEEFDSFTDATIDCGLPLSPKGPAYSSVRVFANDEDDWIDAFLRSWKTATGNGFSLRNLQ
eukprot:TRINITY_DN40718_c0_g1_i1.p1 TRINITY_DN40718_c0_g1~~TRINITY_DN40718_c0_g1_i1.p1  ORF type:complete len:500 (-),score=107.40 TRINITY_DN40718_c0_g1_i1:35-1534(-)